MSLARENNPIQGNRHDESAADIAERLLALPLQAQLGVLRTTTPRALARLGQEQREGFIRDLFGEVDVALRGAHPYDIRTRSSQRPGSHEYLHGDHGWWMDGTQRPDDPWRPGAPPERTTLRWPKGYARSDERVREDVCEALGNSERLDVSDIEVSVTGGEVTLSGTVPTRFEKHVAEEVSESVPGVGQTQNLLRVTRPEVPSSDRRRQRHEGRATATYSRFLDRVAANLAVPVLRAEHIVLSVLHALKQRLTPDEADDLLSQLPFKLQQLLERTDVHEGLRPRDIDRNVFLNMIADDLAVSRQEAEALAYRIFRTLNETVSAGEVRQARHQLPPDLRELWPR